MNSTEGLPHNKRLIRNPISHDETMLRLAQYGDPIAPARGVAVGILLSIPFWLLIGFGFYLLFK